MDPLLERQLAAGAVQDSAGEVRHYGDPLREYHAALEGAVLLDGSARGCLLLSDADAAGLLQRLSTNDVAALSPGEGCRTVLTTHNGRMIDVLTVYVLPEAVQIITSPRQVGAIANLLRRNIFFRDRVRVAENGEVASLLLLYGPQATEVLTGCGVGESPELALHHHCRVEIAGAGCLLARELPLGGQGLALLVPTDGVVAVWDGLLRAGARPLGQQSYDMLRVECGYGVFGREFSGDYIPLEAGLWDAVSFTKGCYVGQEIIARMESRGRIARQLRGLRLGAAAEPPADLLVDGGNAGTLTSAVVSPRFGPIGLGYLREAYQEPGREMVVAGAGIAAEVVALPFGEEC